MKHLHTFENFLNEYGPLAGSGNVDQLERIKRDAMKKSERGNTVYVVGGKNETYKISKYYEEGNTYAAYHNGMQMDVDESKVNEAKNKYKITDFPEGSKILFNDGEEWIVVKKGMRGSGSWRNSDEITIKPFNKLAKDKNVSLAIDINLEFLNANAKSITESVNETSEVNERNTKLYVYPSSKKDHQMISNWLERSAFHAEEDSNSFMFSVSGQRDADATERDLDKEFTKLGANASFVLEGRSQIKRKYGEYGAIRVNSEAPVHTHSIKNPQ